MKTLCFAILFAAAFATPRAAFGHGDPIYVTLGNDGRLKTDSRFYGSGPEEIASSVYFTDLPGYGVRLGGSGMPSGAQVAVSVLSALHFSSALSDPPSPDEDSSTLFMEHPLSGDHREATGSTGYLTPITIGAYDAPQGAEWHQHLFYVLEAGSSDAGAYGVLLQIMSPNHSEILPSAPFALIFNAGLNNPGFDEVSGAMARLLLSTGDVNFNGVVNIADLSLVAATWLSADLRGDANHDGLVNISDVALIATKWLNVIGPGPAGYFPPPPAPAPVPEPAAWLLGAMALSGFAWICVTCRRGFGTRPITSAALTTSNADCGAP